MNFLKKLWQEASKNERIAFASLSLVIIVLTVALLVR